MDIDLVYFRLMELREKMSSKENEAMATIKELSERLNAVTADLGVEKEKRYRRQSFSLRRIVECTFLKFSFAK